jgi:membrane-bound lytic murein transglycosylase D
MAGQSSGSTAKENGEAAAAAAAAADAASAEELLASAEAALAAAGEDLARGDAEGYRVGLEEAFAALRRAEAKLSEDPAAFAILRPAYEKLFADLREGLTPPVEPVVELDASAEELEQAEEVHASNGAIYEMPINPDDPLVAKYLALFKEGRRRQHLEEAFQRSGRYRARILAEIRARGLPEELWVVPVVESGYKVNAYSRARAVGLWQFMASTARRYGLTVNEWVDERRDPIKSTQAALDYLKHLYEWFNNWDFALAAYNRGEGGIHRDIAKSHIADFMEMAELQATHRETQNHVPQIHAAAIIAKHAHQYGFELRDEPARADTVVIDYVVDLEVAAQSAGTTEEMLRELNPELRTWVTPVLSKDYLTYALKLPLGSGERYLREIAKVEDKTPKRQVQYAVRRGDTLGSIARKFGVSVASIKRWNSLRSNRIRPGQRLVVMGQRGRSPSAQPASATAASSSPRSEGGALAAGDESAANWTMHTVRRGDTLYAIAKLYNTTVADLRRLNGLRRSGRIFPGQRLRVQVQSDG